MKRSEMLKAALEKSSTSEEAKEFVGWMQEFLDGDKEEASQPTTVEMLKATEKVKEILSKPIDDPAFYVDPNQLPLDWDVPTKRTRKNSDAKKMGIKYCQKKQNMWRGSFLP